MSTGHVPPGKPPPPTPPPVAPHRSQPVNGVCNTIVSVESPRCTTPIVTPMTPDQGNPVVAMSRSGILMGSRNTSFEQHSAVTSVTAATVSPSSPPHSSPLLAVPKVPPSNKPPPPPSRAPPPPPPSPTPPITSILPSAILPTKIHLRHTSAPPDKFSLPPSSSPSLSYPTSPGRDRSSVSPPLDPTPPTSPSPPPFLALTPPSSSMPPPPSTSPPVPSSNTSQTAAQLIQPRTVDVLHSASGTITAAVHSLVTSSVFSSVLQTRERTNHTIHNAPSPSPGHDSIVPQRTHHVSGATPPRPDYDGYYLQLSAQLWQQHACCNVQTSGPVSITMYFARNSMTRVMKFDLKHSVSDVLCQALKDFERKGAESESTSYGLFLRANSSQSLVDSYWLIDEAPMWMFFIGPQDLVEIRPKKEAPEEISLLKVFVPEQHATTTLRVDPATTVLAVMRLINQYSWGAIDVRFCPISEKHLQYYALFFLSSTQGWLQLSESSTLASNHLPKLSIVCLKRKPLIAVKFENASGSIEKSINSTVATQPGQYKITLSTEQTMGEVMCSLIKWTEQMFGSISWTSKTKPKTESKLAQFREAVLSHTSQDPEQDEDNWNSEAESQATEEFQLLLQGHPLDVTQDMGEQEWNSGDVLTLRMGENSIQFLVSYSPTTMFSKNHSAIQMGIDFEGETLVLDGINDVRHVFVSPPANQFSSPTITIGYVYISNFQFVFKSFHNTQKDEIKIPLNTILKIDKSMVNKKGPTGRYYLDITCKEGRTVRFGFPKKSIRRSQLIKTISDICFNPDKFFAFSYRPSYPNSGWSIYKPAMEYQRQRIGASSGWRISNVNQNYQFCDTYPSVFVVPDSASDDLLASVGNFRSKQRIAVLSWRHSTTGATITRCAQPCVGLKGSRSFTDEEYIQLIMNTNHTNPNFLYILDARSKSSAMANRARGGGYEELAFYPQCKLEFEEIANIHGVRDAYQKFRDQYAPAVGEEMWYLQLEQSRWLNLQQAILASVTKTVHIIEKLQMSMGSHCTMYIFGNAVPGSLLQVEKLSFRGIYLIRSIIGFEILIEKEWLSFGHKFGYRCAHGEAKPSDQRSPIFPQFIECVYQLICQYPFCFQFNETFLMAIMDNIYSCQFGITQGTISLWSYLNSQLDKYINPFYTPEPTVLYPDSSIKTLRHWHNYHMSWYYKLETESAVTLSREKRSTEMHTATLRLNYDQLQKQFEEYKNSHP
ncbi:Myotubularin-like phosphatase domain [Pelomyxa schiedti]|nr:Myotubularin-like phosphatase domain [Pelomyxa schiedti]